jgi:hypothetical protein
LERVHGTAETILCSLIGSALSFSAPLRRQIRPVLRLRPFSRFKLTDEQRKRLLLQEAS